MDTIQTHLLDPTSLLFEGPYPTPDDSEVLPDFMDSFFAPDPQQPLIDFDFAASDAPLHDKDTISDVKPNQPKPPRPLLPRDAPDPTGVHTPLMFAALPNGCPDSAINASMITDLYNRIMTFENTTATFRQVFDISARLTSVEARLVGMENRQMEMESRHTSMETRQTTMETRKATTETETEPGDLSERFEQFKARTVKNVTRLHEFCAAIQKDGETSSP